MTAIIARGLVRRFSSRGKETVEAVRGVDLDVKQGEVFGFLGPNGAGKTTIVRMLTTLLPLTEGTATVAGCDVTLDPAGVRTKIGVALQEAGLDPLQTGRELLTLQCGLYGMNGPQAKNRAEELLVLVGLTDAADRRVKTYSGGMKRRLDLASALVHEPEVLFLDEPTTGLDPASRMAVWQEVRRINADGTTVFLTTQYLEEADQLCDRVAIIDAGLLVREGTPEELKSAVGHDVVGVTLALADHAATIEVLRGLPVVEKLADADFGVQVSVSQGAAAVPLIVSALDDAGITAQAVSISRPTLDDVFLEATGRRLEGASEKEEGA